MRIGELAKQTQLSQSSIRFYEQKGLISPTARSASGYRIYDEQALNRLIQIKFCQQLGFSLDDILAIINVQVGLDHQQVLAKLGQRKQEVKGLIAQLTDNLDNIEKLEGRLATLWQDGECMSRQEMETLLKQSTF